MNDCLWMPNHLLELRLAIDEQVKEKSIPDRLWWYFQNYLHKRNLLLFLKTLAFFFFFLTPLRLPLLLHVILLRIMLVSLCFLTHWAYVWSRWLSTLGWGRHNLSTNKSLLHCFPRFTSEHRFWAPSEVEEEVENKEITEMLKTRYITFAGKFEPVKHKCRAPMPDGSLCERQDRIKVSTK